LSDAAFTWEEFQASVNSDLANVLGNFVNRITKYCVGKFDGKVPAGGENGEAEAWLIKELETRLPQLVAYYEAREFRKAMAETRGGLGLTSSRSLGSSRNLLFRMRRRRF